MKRGNNRSKKKNGGGLRKYKVPIIIAVTVVVMAVSLFYITKYLIFRAIYKRVGAAATKVTRMVENDESSAGVEKLMSQWEDAERERQHQKRTSFRRNVQMLKEGLKKEQQVLSQRQLQLIEETMSTTRDQIKKEVSNQIVETFKKIQLEQARNFEQKISNTVERVSRQVNQDFQKIVLENKRDRVDLRRQIKEDANSLEQRLAINQSALEKAQAQRHEMLAARLVEEQEVLKSQLRTAQQQLKDEENILKENLLASQRTLEKGQQEHSKQLTTKLAEEQEALQRALKASQKQVEQKHELLAARLVGGQKALKDQIKHNEEQLKARIVGEQILLKEMVAKKQQTFELEVAEKQAMLNAKLSSEQMKLREKLEQDQQLLAARLAADQQNVARRLTKDQRELKEVLTAQLAREQMALDRKIDDGHKLLVATLKEKQEHLSTKNYDRLHGELVAAKAQMQKDVARDLDGLKKEVSTAKSRLERDTVKNFAHLEDEIKATKNKVEYDVTQNLAHMKKDLFSRIEALRLADFSARELEQQKLAQTQKDLADKHLKLIQEKLSVSDERMRKLVAENETHIRKQEVSAAARIEAFKACLMSAEDRSQKRIAKLQDQLRKDAAKKLVAAMSTYQEQSARELEDWKRLRNSYVDQAAQHRERQLELFDVRLAAAKDKMQVHVDGQLKLIAQASQQEREKHQEDLSKRYVSLFNVSLQSAEKKAVANIENKFKVLAASAEEKIRKDGEMLKDKYLQLFDVKLANAQGIIKKQAEDKMKVLAVESKKSRDDEMRQNRLALKNVTQDYLETFQKRLDASKESMAKTLAKNIKEMADRDVQERRKAYDSLIAKHMKLFDGKIVQMQTKLEKKHIGMFSEQLKVAQNQVGAKQSALLEKNFASKMNALKQDGEKQTELLKSKFSSEVENLKLFAQSKLKEIAQTEEGMRQRAYQGLLDKQLQAFNEKLVETKGTLQQQMEEKLGGVAAQARLERHWEKDEHSKKQEVLSKEYLDVFNVQLACAKDSIKKEAEQQLQALMERDTIKWGQEQQVLSQKYLTLFENKISTTQETVKGEIDENFKKLALVDAQKRTAFEEQRRKEMEELAAKHLQAFDEKMLQTEQNIRAKAQEKFNELAEMGYKEIVGTGEKQFAIFDKKVQQIQEQVGGQAKEEFMNLIVAHKEESRAEHDQFAKKQLATFNNRLMAMQQQLEKEAEKKLNDVVLVVNRIGTFAEENNKQFEGKLLATDAKLLAMKEEGDTNLLAMKAEVEGVAKAKLGEIADKVEQIAVGVEAGQQELRAELEKRDAIFAEQGKALDLKLLALQKDIETTTRTRLVTIADKVEQIAVGVEDERQVRQETFLAEQQKLLDTKLAAVRQEFALQTQEKMKNLVGDIYQAAVEAQTKGGQVRKEFVKKQEALLEEKIAAVRDAMQQQFKTLLEKEEAKRVAAREKQKMAIESLTSNMLQAIEWRLAANSDGQKQDNREFESLVEKLKGVTHSQSAQLRQLSKKLEEKQKEKMVGDKALGKRGGAISQEEIDALVKKEVDKQLSILRLKQDPRRSRLKKVVALEKMRRLVNNLAEGNHYGDAIEF